MIEYLRNEKWDMEFFSNEIIPSMNIVSFLLIFFLSFSADFIIVILMKTIDEFHFWFDWNFHFMIQKRNITCEIIESRLFALF